jgi:hypothetical protein
MTISFVNVVSNPNKLDHEMEQGACSKWTLHGSVVKFPIGGRRWTTPTVSEDDPDPPPLNPP